MSDLRTEIREAFEKEQSAYPPPASMRFHVTAAVAVRRAGHADHVREGNLHWLAVAAALLLTAALVAGLIAVRFSSRPVVPAGGDYGMPPAGVPLLYVVDPTHPSWLQAYDWNRNPRGTIKLDGLCPPRASCPLQQAPDGQQFQIFGNGSGQAMGQFMDRLGKRLQNSPFPARTVFGIWADDSRHLCVTSFDSSTRIWVLTTLFPGLAKKVIALPNVIYTSITVIACSFSSDRAILVRTADAGVTEIWVVRLSDGAVISHRSYRPYEVASAAATSDAAYLAENYLPNSVAAKPHLRSHTIIRSLSDWSAVGMLADPVNVIAFSGDASIAMVSEPTGDPMLSSFATIDWRSGQTLWTYDGRWSIHGLLAEPGGRKFAVALGDNPIWRTPPCLRREACDSFVPVRVAEIIDGASTLQFPAGYTPIW